MKYPIGMMIEMSGVNDAADWFEHAAKAERLSSESPWSASKILAFAEYDNTTLQTIVKGGEYIGHLMITHLFDHLEVTKITIAKNHRRKKIATKAMKGVMGACGPDRLISSVVSFVDEENLPAQLFFKSLGFKGESTSGEKIKFTWKGEE